VSLDIARWLASIGLPQYTQIFEAQGFDELGLAELTDADLEKLGISAMGHRKIILREASRLAGRRPDGWRFCFPMCCESAVRRSKRI
jgi:hypothetical protein